MTDAIQQLVMTLNQSGVHTGLKAGSLEVSGRSCMAYLSIGAFSLIDIQVINIEKQDRGQGIGKMFMANLIDEADREGRDAIRFTNLINPRFEDFLIRLGFRLLGTADYILLSADFASARSKTLSMLNLMKD